MLAAMWTSALAILGLFCCACVSGSSGREGVAPTAVAAQEAPAVVQGASSGEAALELELGSLRNARVALDTGGGTLPVTFLAGELEPGELHPGLVFRATDKQATWSGDAAPALPIDGRLDLHKGVYNRIVREFNGGRPMRLTLTPHTDAPPEPGLG
mgnify:CR=1 FL=1